MIHSMYDTNKACQTYIFFGSPSLHLTDEEAEDVEGSFHCLGEAAVTMLNQQ